MSLTTPTKTVLFLDNTTLNYIFGSGNSYRPDFGVNYLNQLAKNYDIKVTDRVLAEARGHSGFGDVIDANGVKTEGLFENWMAGNNITEIETTQAPGTNAGELSIVEASKQPQFAGQEFKIATDDTTYFNKTGLGKDYVSKTLQIQGLSGELLKSGGLNITDYNDLATKYAGLNSSRDWVPKWLSPDQAFNETPFAQAKGHVANEAGIVTDTHTGIKYNLSEVFKNFVTSESGSPTSIADLAHYIGTDVATIEAAILRGTGAALAGLGIAAIAADILHTSVTARAQIDSGNRAGAAQSVESLAARVGLGITGAEAGFATGVAWAGEAAAVGLIAASAPLDLVAGLILAAAVGIAGIVDGNALVKLLNGAIDSLIHGMESLVDGWGSGSGDGSSADGSGGDGSSGSGDAFPSGGATVPGSEVPGIHNGFNSSMTDPIVLGLGGNPIALNSLATSKAYFDLYGNNFAVHTGWVGAKTGFLVNSATPTSINNLFGNSTTDGFTALKALDSDKNNIIDNKDAGFSKLYVWEDANGNGIADPGEVKSLAALGITSISLKSAPVDQTVGGNHIAQVATFTYSNGTTGQVAEAFLNNDTVDSKFIGSYTLDPSVLLLPNLRGYGTLKPLYIAMSLDKNLLGLVKNFTTQKILDTSVIADEVTAIIYKWAGVDNIDPTSRGIYFDAQKLAVLEAFNGEKFVSTFGGTNSSNPIGTHEGETLTAAWNELLASVEARLLVQGPFASVFPKITFDYDTDSLVGSLDATAIAVGAPKGGFLAGQYWHDMTNISAMVADGLGISASQALSTVQTAFNQTHVSYSWASTQGDNFIFAAGDGNKTINENNKTSGVLTIANTNANAANTILQANDNGDLTVVLSTGDKITFQNDLSFADGASSMYGNFSKITQINFASGTPLILNNYNWAGLATSQQLTFTWNDTAGNNNIVGSKFGNNLFNLGGGNDTVTAGTPTSYTKNTTNTFVFHKGDGHDIVNLNGGTGVLKLAADIAVSDVTPTKNANGDLTISLITGDSITFLNDLSFADGTSDQHGYASKVSQIQFANGVIWDKNRILTSGKGDYYVAGSGNDDLYVHKQGDGVGTIFENGFSGNDTLKFTGTALTSTGVTVTRSADLMSATLSFAGVTDKITLDGQFGPYGEGIENITFSNGVTWTKDDLQKKYLATVSTTGNDTIYGFGSNINHAVNDVITGGKGDDYMDGGYGSDTYIHNQGDGVDTVADGGLSGNDTIKFTGTALTSTNAVLTRSGDDMYSITIGFAGLTDKVILKNEFNSASPISNIIFSNGVTWHIADLQTNYIAKAGTAGNDKIYGFSNANETITGGKGDDYMAGSGGDDTYIHNQGDGVDTIDEWFWGSGNDTLKLTGTNLTSSNFALTAAGPLLYDAVITFGGVTDKITLVDELNWSPNSVEKIIFSDGVTLNRADLIVGAYTNDTLTGNANNNFLFGLGGNDTINAGNGNDLLNGGVGADKLDGGAGIDTVSYLDSSAAVNVNLGITTAQSGGDAAGDTLFNIENIIGSSLNDTFISSSVANKIDGGAGIDTVSYATSTAAVNVNLGLTTAQTGGHAAGDTLFNIENIIGSNYNDTLLGNALVNIINGGFGADKIDGGAGNDTVSYAGSTAAVNVNLGITTAQAGGHAAGDTLFNMENIIGSSYNDTLFGSSVANIITGGAGNDKMTGGAGADVFKYSSVTDSGAAAGARDVIADFVNGTDKIDLADFAGTFAFKGTGAFTHTAHEVNYAQVSGNTIIGIDADGNGTLDMQIELTGLHTMTASDFLL